MKFRIVNRRGKHFVQYKTWFSWQTVQSISEIDIEFTSAEEAEDWIKEKYDAEVIVKEITIV